METNNFIQDFFDDGGILSKKLPGYKKRETQIQAANLVEESIKNKQNIALQMPVGAGKTHMYSVPSIKYALENDKKVVISCPSIMLQSQLIDKDLPFLKESLRETFPFSYSLIKGRNNYICNKKIEDNNKNNSYSKGSVTNDEFKQFNDLWKWYNKTEDGDIGDLEFTISSKIKEENTITDNECTGRNCAFYDKCFSQKIRQKAYFSNVIVVNYHILLLDIMIKQDGGKGVLPDYDVLILDEGHRLVEISRDFLGYEINPFSLKRQMNRLLKAWKSCFSENQYPNNLLSGEPKEFDKIFDKMIFNYLSEIQKYCKTLGEYQKNKKESILSYSDNNKLPSPDDMIKSLDDVLSVAEKMYNYLEFELDDRNADGETTSADKELLDRMNTFDKCIESSYELKNFISIVYNKIISNPEWEKTNYVANISMDRNGVVDMTKLNIIPVNVNDDLNSLIWNNDSIASTIVCSATLKGGDTFDYFIESSGFSNGNCYSFKSEFNLKEQMEIIIDARMPDPKDIYENKNIHEIYTNTLVKNIKFMIEERKGGVLILSTSMKQTLELRDRLIEVVDPQFPILCQYDGQSQAKIVNEFRQNRHASLIGSQSLFEGIDVIGDSLNSVVICKLPFKHIFDPIATILSARNENSFFKYSLPLAVICFTQGCGRLIRTATDTGLVYICDPRVVTKQYGKSFLSFFNENEVKVTTLNKK